MGDPLISDKSLTAARAALDGLTLQQDVIGHNLANIDTPGYRSQTVDFQTSLRRALGSGRGLQLRATHVAHQGFLQRADRAQMLNRPGGALRADGNNVDIDVEMAQMTETGIQYQAITQLVTKKFQLLKSLAQGR
jgi:flagellar basal-body rod protein FlgB